jgi:hypothetical protein
MILNFENGKTETSINNIFHENIKVVNVVKTSKYIKRTYKNKDFLARDKI